MEAMCMWNKTWMFGNTDTACYANHCETSRSDVSIFLEHKDENWCKYGYNDVYTQPPNPVFVRRDQWGYTTEVRSSVSSTWTVNANMTLEQRKEAEVKCRWMDGVQYYPEQVLYHFLAILFVLK